jgi:uncharacterized protein YbjQ (UPF0145 family)
MVSCFLSTCPQSHRRPRDLVRRNWSHLVSEVTPVWAVLVDDRPAVVAPADDRLVVVCGGMRAVDWTVGFGQITEVSSARSVVYVVDDDGHCYDFTFLDSGDAVRAAVLIEQRRTAARGTGDGAVGGPDVGAIERWEGWRAMEPVGQGDADQVDFGRPGSVGQPVSGEQAASGEQPVQTGTEHAPLRDTGDRPAVDPAAADRGYAEQDDRAELARAEADAAAIEAERAAGRAAADPPWTGAAQPDRPSPNGNQDRSAVGADPAAADEAPTVRSDSGADADTAMVTPEVAAAEPDRPAVEETEPEWAPLPAANGHRDPTTGTGNGHHEAAASAIDAIWRRAAANGNHEGHEGAAAPADEPLSAPIVDVPVGAFGELPIEREVAMAIARSGGEPVDWWSIPPRAAEPPAPEQPLPIPAQAPAHASESVLLVTTEGVPGRTVLEVHGDVLAVASWPAPGPAGRSVHEVARDRLAQAVLQRGGNALVGLRYGATGMVGGDVVAYGTSVTLAPLAAPATTDPHRTAGAADR